MGRDTDDGLPGRSGCRSRGGGVGDGERLEWEGCWWVDVVQPMLRGLGLATLGWVLGRIRMQDQTRRAPDGCIGTARRTHRTELSRQGPN
jgi:hypothetical protein